MEKEINLKGGLENIVLDHKLMYIGKENQAGWDYLYEDCFDGINKIVNDNLKGNKHDEILIDKIYGKMIVALEKARIKMDKLQGDKGNWYKTYNTILEFSETAYTPNKKIITINVIDQHLRRTY